MADSHGGNSCDGLLCKLVLDFTLKSHELQGHKHKNKKISACFSPPYLSPGTSEWWQEAHSMHRTTSSNSKPVQERQCSLGCVLTSIPESKPGQNTANLLLRKMLRVTRLLVTVLAYFIWEIDESQLVPESEQTLWLWLHNSAQKSGRYFY